MTTQKRFEEAISKEVYRNTKKCINEASKSCAKIYKDEISLFLKWLTAKDSKYAIMYGGTPELDKDYRFASNDEDFTIEEILDIYTNTKENEKA